MVERHRDCSQAHGLLTKSFTDDRGARLIKRDVDAIDDTGFEWIMLITGNEVVLEALQRRIRARADVDVVPQHSVVRQQASNGTAGDAVREAEAQIRCMELSRRIRLRQEFPLRVHLVLAE